MDLSRMSAKEKQQFEEKAMRVQVRKHSISKKKEFGRGFLLLVVFDTSELSIYIQIDGGLYSNVQQSLQAVLCLVCQRFYWQNALAKGGELLCFCATHSVHA